MISDDTPYLHHWEENIQKVCGLVESNKLLDVEQDNRGAVNIFSGQVATPEQSVDILQNLIHYSLPLYVKVIAVGY